LLRVGGDRPVLAPISVLVAGQSPLPQRARRPRVPRSSARPHPRVSCGPWVGLCPTGPPPRPPRPRWLRAPRRRQPAPTHRPAMVNLGLPSPTSVEVPTGPSRRCAKELRAAVRNAGFEFPQRRVTVNLAPRPVGAPSGPTWRTCGPPRSPRTPCSVTRCPVLDGLIDSGVDLFGRYSESAIQDTRRHFHKS
jgi:hypothetical protein